MIPFSRPDWGELEQQYVSQAIGPDRVPFEEHFKNGLEKLTGSSTILTSSCTKALELIAHHLKSRPGFRGGELICPSWNFVSSSLPFFSIADMRLVLCDVDDTTLCIDVDLVEQSITSRTRAILYTNYAGLTPDLEKLADIASKYDLVLIEDNAHGFASTRVSETADFSVTSFHHTKNLSTGEGGALTVQNLSSYNTILDIANKGTNRAQFETKKLDKYTWVSAGTNGKLPNHSCALGVGQLSRRDEILGNRQAIFSRYLDAAKGWETFAPIRRSPARSSSASHIFYLRFEQQALRDSYIEHCKENGIVASFHYQALNLSPFARNNPRKIHGVTAPNSESASSNLVRLPIWSGMTSSMVDMVTDVTDTFINQHFR